ncbi:MAG: hypothetical protein M3Y08_05670 [Fibrobacterota bacterium]|nr:hypothetical protein [Fibrobacterota bacterium]
MTLARKCLFILGLFLLFGFTMTGQYLEHVLKPQYGDDEAHRMMARASHLYLLFISLMLMLASLIPVPVRRVGSATALSGVDWRVRLMALGYSLMVVSSGLLIVSFFREHSGNLSDRMLAVYGCMSALAGGLLIAAGALRGGAFGPAGPQE